MCFRYLHQIKDKVKQVGRTLSFDYLSLRIPNVIFFAAFSSKLGYEEHIPGQTRDWNEELQTTRELPRATLPERLLRERAIFKASE